METAAQRERAFTWASSTVASRGQGGLFVASNHSCHLVPGIDAINHVSGPAALAPAAVPEPLAGGAAGVKAARAYRPGEEIHVRYFHASHCNHLVYLQYGFALREPARDCLPLELPDSGFESVVAHDGSGFRVTAPAAYVLTAAGPVPPGLMAVLRSGHGSTLARGTVIKARAEAVPFASEAPHALCSLDALLLEVQRNHTKLALGLAPTDTMAHMELLRQGEARVAEAVRASVAVALAARGISCPEEGEGGGPGRSKSGGTTSVSTPCMVGACPCEQ
jgi:hypothetical protein